MRAVFANIVLTATEGQLSVNSPCRAERAYANFGRHRRQEARGPMYEFVRNPAFPDSKTRITAKRKLWKIEVREWAFAEVDVKDAPDGLKPESNNPNVSPGCFDKADRAIRWTQSQ